MNDVRKVSKDEALKELSELRKGGGSGNSKYHPVLEEAEAEIDGEDDALILDTLDGDPISDTQVSGMRDYLNRHREGKYLVRSHSVDDAGEKYRVVIFLDVEE